MKQLILRWLNGRRNYTVGKLLYDQYGSNEDKKALFSTGKTPLTDGELLTALQNLLTEDELPVAKEVDQPFEQMPDDKDAVLAAIKAEWLPHYTEMNYKRHQLDPLLSIDTPDAELRRALLAKDILMLEQKCQTIWAKRDYYLQHKKLPGISTDKEVVVADFKAARRIESVKTYIRQYRKKVKDNPADARAVMHLNRFNNELEQLQQLYGQK